MQVQRGNGADRAPTNNKDGFLLSLSHGEAKRVVKVGIAAEKAPTYAGVCFRGWVDRARFLTRLVVGSRVERGGATKWTCRCRRLQHHKAHVIRQTAAKCITGGLTITTCGQNRSFQSSSICCKCWLQSVEFVGSNLLIPRCSASLRFHFVALMHSMSRLGKPSIPSA